MTPRGGNTSQRNILAAVGSFINQISFSEMMNTVLSLKRNKNFSILAVFSPLQVFWIETTKIIAN